MLSTCDGLKSLVEEQAQLHQPVAAAAAGDKSKGTLYAASLLLPENTSNNKFEFLRSGSHDDKTHPHPPRHKPGT